MSDPRGIIKEGFICAECHATFAGAEELKKHYENDHVQSSTIKALLGKAKQKTKDIQQSITINPFLQSSSSSSSNTTNTATAPSISSLSTTYIFEPQQLGTCRSHMNNFKSYRNVKIERYASEGNKLLIRLLKLCDGLPDDPSKRKAHEQSIVNWMDEKSVTRCPDCTEAFNVLLKRKHHCRLCGSVLCDDCSQFIGLSEAKLLTRELGQTKKNSHLQDEEKNRKSQQKEQQSNIKREESDYMFRSCSYCCTIMENRKANYEIQESGKKLISDHNDLKSTLLQAERLIPELVKVVDSLNSGESLYSIQQANSLRGDIMRLTEKVDSLSKRIAAGQSVNSSDSMLRQRIRSSTVISIRMLLVNLPVIPGEEYLNELKAKSMEGITGQMKPKETKAEVVRSAGWVGEVKNIPLVDDPIEQQIMNLQEFIKQAKLAQKADEVEMLQQSLKDLLDLKQSMLS